ncbi:MAG: WD40 repeat domain-containing serine/threonine protein kinase [Myxococcales bacterium]
MSEPPDRDSGKTLARPDVAAGQATVVREEGTLVREESTLVRGGSGAASGEEGAVTPETPGRYDVRSEYGRGGQSRVMLAFDQHMGREIALKQLLAPGEGSGSSGSQAASSRFVREARITGQLEHPNIVPVYELGQHADGSYYYTQKLVRGVTLKAKLREARSLAERLKLLSHFADICHAMAYAHSRGVVHRDLKPDNVMVGQFGETVVLDGGLAKARGEKDVKAKQLQRETEAMRADATMAVHALGTPSYMSPEQAQGNLEEIDERSDVWSLGAILFEILTGRPPFEGSSAYSVIEKVIKDAPPRVRAVLRDAPPELAAVAERALSREKALRYASAEEIAGEVEAYLTGGNVRAYQYSSWELLRRFVQKHRALTAVSGLALLLLIAALIVIRDEAARARAALGEARHNLAQAFLEKAHSAEHDFLWHRAEIYFAAARVQEDGPEARWGSVIEGGGAAGVTRISGPEGWVRAAAFSPDGQAIAAASSDGTARLFDLSTGRERWSFRAARQMAAVAFSSDGKTVTTRDDGGIVRILDASTGAQSSSSRSPVRPKPEPVTATSPDGKLVATAESRTVTLWDARSHVRLELLPRPAPIIGLAFSPDSKQVAIAEQQSALVLWNVERRPMARGYARLPDGGPLTVPTSGRGLVQRNADGKLARTFAQDVRIDAAAASPDGKRVAAVGPDGLVFIDLGSGRRLRSIASARGRALRFLSDGSVLVNRGPALDLYRDELLQSFAAPAGATFDEVLESGGLIVARHSSAEVLGGLEDSGLMRIDLATRTLLPATDLKPSAIALTADGSTLAAGAAGQILLLDPRTLARREALEMEGAVPGSLAFSPRGDLLAAAGGDAAVHLYAGGQEVAHLPIAGALAVTNLRFSADGSRLMLFVEKPSDLPGDEKEPAELRTLPIGDPSKLPPPEEALRAVLAEHGVELRDGEISALRR